MWRGRGRVDLKGANACPPPLQKSANLAAVPFLPAPSFRPPSPVQAPSSSFRNSFPLFLEPFFLHPHLGPEDWHGKCSGRRKFGDRRVGPQVGGGRGNAPEARAAVLGGHFLAWARPGPGEGRDRRRPRPRSRHPTGRRPRAREGASAGREACEPSLFLSPGSARAFTWRPQPQ